jgi:hypothetical protein
MAASDNTFIVWPGIWLEKGHGDAACKPSRPPLVRLFGASKNEGCRA